MTKPAPTSLFTICLLPRARLAARASRVATTARRLCFRAPSGRSSVRAVSAAAWDEASVAVIYD